MGLAGRVPVGVVGAFGLVEADQRQQEQPCRQAERRGQRRDAQRRKHDVHARLHEYRHDDSQQGPHGRTAVGLVEDRAQSYGRQHGAESVEPARDSAARSLEQDRYQQRHGRTDGGPQRGAGAAQQQPDQKQQPRHPRIDQEHLPEAFEPVDDQVAQPQVFARREKRRQRRVAQMGGRHPVHGARRQQKEPRAEDKRESQRVDFPRGHHVVESRAYPGRHRRAEYQRQPHPEGVAQERGEGAAYEHSVEAPQPLRAVVFREPQQPARQRGDRHRDECAPRYDARAVGARAPDDACQKQQAGPCAGLEHDLPHAAQHFLEKADSGVGRRRRESCCHSL